MVSEIYRDTLTQRFFVRHIPWAKFNKAQASTLETLHIVGLRCRYEGQTDEKAYYVRVGLQLYKMLRTGQLQPIEEPTEEYNRDLRCGQVVRVYFQREDGEEVNDGSIVEMKDGLIRIIWRDGQVSWTSYCELEAWNARRLTLSK